MLQKNLSSTTELILYIAARLVVIGVKNQVDCVIPNLIFMGAYPASDNCKYLRRLAMRDYRGVVVVEGLRIR